MNRISRRSAAEAADALLEAGRTQPVLHYDVESGLARHHHWLRSEAPMPEWASTGAGTAATSLAPVAIKTVVSAVLIGALAVAAWHARDRSQPSAATAKRPSPAAERTHSVAPGVPEVPASDAWMATTPMPVSDHGPASDPPKHTARLKRAHGELTSARAASARGERAVPAAERVDAPPAHAREEPATASPERTPISAAHEERPEPAPRAQTPDDLAEMQDVARAERLLQRSPQRALALVREGDRRFASGYFQQERAYIAIMALIGLGRIDEARVRAASFAERFPLLPYGARIRSALDARR